MSVKVSESHFNMWRAIFSLTMVDGVQTDSEVECLASYLGKLPLSDEQRKTLMKDLDSPRNVESFFPLVTEARDRAMIIYYARLLFWSDGDFDQQEQKILESMHSEAMSKVDLEAVMHDVDKEVAQAQERLVSARENQSWSQRMVDTLVFWEDLF